MRKIVVLSGLLLLPMLQAEAQDKAIYRAYVEIRMDQWLQRMEQMERSCALKRDRDECYELLVARYGYVAYCISVGRKKDAREIWEKALRQAAWMSKRYSDDARVFSLQGAIHGYGAVMEPFRAPGHGKRARVACDKAIALDSLEPMAWMEQAHMAHHAPPILGGSKPRAIRYYTRAIQLFEDHPEKLPGNWLYLNCLAGLAQVFEEEDQMQRAGALYRKILRIEPDFSWVKDDLYPAWKEKQGRNSSP